MARSPFVFTDIEADVDDEGVATAMPSVLGQHQLIRRNAFGYAGEDAMVDTQGDSFFFA